jgi:predicted ATP-dependent endonuclease of OLD family
MRLDGFGISGYKSFGENMVYFNDLGKVNIFMGKNNSGKSNILDFCKRLSSIRLNKNYEQQLNDLDYHNRLEEKEISFAIQVKKDSDVTGKIFKQIENIIKSKISCFQEWEESIWFPFAISKLGSPANYNPYREKMALLLNNRLNENETYNLAHSHLNLDGVSHTIRCEKFAEKFYSFFCNSFQFDFSVYSIPTFRQIIPGGGSTVQQDGKGLIRELRELQHPTKLAEKKIKKQKFDDINNLLKKLLGEEDAHIELPSGNEEIHVTIKDNEFPLDSFGTGIHQLILLASYVTIYDNSIFCIEEPEIHLHPELQKKFLLYLRDNTTNQYLISTHSNACFDIQGINIYHCYLKDNKTHCQLVKKDEEKFPILADLGYKPSDILQSNFIIWVEGPSDRIYLNHWIKGKNPFLVEGIDYTIMFYGGSGSLLHLSFDFDEDEIKDFIKLCKFNRNAAIVIDSDKSKDDGILDKTKEQFIKSFEEYGYVWVTAGREIENYIPDCIFKECVKRVHPSINEDEIYCGQYEKITHTSKGAKINKVKVAKKVAEQKADYSNLDLDKKVNELIKNIENAN